MDELNERDDSWSAPIVRAVFRGVQEGLFMIMARATKIHETALPIVKLGDASDY
ncbi:hypothetical protein Tco_0093899, partial [Tanacetum coccineum]